MATTTLTTVYETDGLKIKSDAEGMLYMTTNSVADERITPALYGAMSGEQIACMRDSLVAEGMPAAIADQIVRQAETWA